MATAITAFLAMPGRSSRPSPKRADARPVPPPPSTPERHAIAEQTTDRRDTEGARPREEMKEGEKERDKEEERN